MGTGIQSLALLSESKDLALLWLWCRLAAAVLIQPLAWELPYVVGAALKKAKNKNKLKRELGMSVKNPKERKRS